MYPPPGTHHTDSPEHKYENLQFQIIAYLVLFHKQEQRAIHFHHHQEPSKTCQHFCSFTKKHTLQSGEITTFLKVFMEFCFLENTLLFTTLLLQDHLPSGKELPAVSRVKPSTAACCSFYPDSQLAIRTVCYSDSLNSIANNEAEESGEPAKELAHLKGTIATQQQILG